MTPSELETAARQMYNAVGDNNWSSPEIMTLIYGGCLELVRECGLVIEKRYTTTSTAGVGEYSYPTNATGIKRITFDGKKLAEITMRQDDSLTLENQLTTAVGSPTYYYVWSGVIYLRAIPETAGTLTLFTTSNPQPVTATSVLEVPDNAHLMLRDYVVSEMAAKDLNFKMADYYRNLWGNPNTGHKAEFRRFLRRNKRADAFAVVQVEELLPYGSMGNQ